MATKAKPTAPVKVEPSPSKLKHVLAQRQAAAAEIARLNKTLDESSEELCESLSDFMRSHFINAVFLYNAFGSDMTSILRSKVMDVRRLSQDVLRDSYDLTDIAVTARSYFMPEAYLDMLNHRCDSRSYDRYSLIDTLEMINNPHHNTPDCIEEITSILNAFTGAHFLTNMVADVASNLTGKFTMNGGEIQVEHLLVFDPSAPPSLFSINPETVELINEIMGSDIPKALAMTGKNRIPTLIKHVKFLFDLTVIKNSPVLYRNILDKAVYGAAYDHGAIND